MDAFEAELIGLLPRLRTFALGLTLDPAKADDLVQAGCERALIRQHQWQPGTRLDSWIFRILKNLWIDEIRAQPFAMNVELEAAEDMPGEDWNLKIEAELTLDQVVAHIAKLPEEMRMVLVLVCVEGLPYKEAAEMLSVPVGTVMSRLSRARVALHKLVNAAATPNIGGDRAPIQ